MASGVVLNNRALQAYATHLVGTWQAEDEHGDACVLRFNRFNMVSVETPDVRQKGPVEWSEQSFTAGPLPVLSFLGESKTFKVTHWPASTADVLAVDGLNYRKVK